MAILLTLVKECYDHLDVKFGITKVALEKYITQIEVIRLFDQH